MLVGPAKTEILAIAMLNGGFEILCLLGRGIEQVRIGSDLVWRPTRYVERPTLEGRHSGLRHGSAAPHDDSSLIAGSNAIIIAGCQLLKEVNRLGELRLVIFTAGRPSYLEAHSPLGLTEGAIMLERFRRGLRDTDFEYLILGTNRNTRDEMRETCQAAVSRGLTRVRAVTVSVHVPRTREFARQACREFPGVSFQVEAAEDVLCRRYSNRPRCLEDIRTVKCSPCYDRTAESERRGLEALRSGHYGFC
jgi:hypothetical protein